MASRRAPGNLPTEVSSFVGRRQEEHELRQLLAQARLVSVVGPGGVGKSRLALRVATKLQRTFRDGIWLVELAPVADPALLPEAVAGALGVPERAGRDPVEALSKYLVDRELMVVLDNCEQLKDACAALLAAMLPHAPGVRVLDTSQEVLGLPGEAVYRLQPLAVPDLGDAAERAEVFPAVALFADRAASALNGFKVSEENVDVVVELCRRLDGMPLAIELAAAHARFLAPAQILRRLDDRFHLVVTRSSAVPRRHQSLKAAVEWSYELCGKPERLLWNRLAIFQASFDLAAAEAVCAGDGLAGAEVAEAIANLVDRSVLIPEPRGGAMRYRMLETIREYGLHMLRESPDSEHAVSEAVLRSRNLNWFVELAEEFDRDWFGPGQHDWLERLLVELPNIRAALSLAVDDSGHGREGLRLAGSLCFFWRVSALREGESWLTRLLSADAEASTERAGALLALGHLMAARGQEGGAVASEALTISEHHDPDRVPRALFLLGVFTCAEDPWAARDGLLQAVALAQQLGSVAETAYALFGDGWSLGLAGAPDQAQARFQESLALCEAAGECWWRGVVHFRRALIAWMHADLPLMSVAATDALRASRRVSDLLTCADAVVVTGVAAVGRDDRHAAYLFGAAERYWEDAGGSVVCTSPWGPLLEDAKDRCRAAIGTEAFDEHYQQGKDHPLHDAIASALGERPPLTTPHPPEKQSFGLTQRELEILELISQGLTNREIAARLVISTRTAETHVQNILTKTGFSNRSQAAAWHAARANA